MSDSTIQWLKVPVIKAAIKTRCLSRNTDFPVLTHQLFQCLLILGRERVCWCRGL